MKLLELMRILNTSHLDGMFGGGSVSANLDSVPLDAPHAEAMVCTNWMREEFGIPCY